MTHCYYSINTSVKRLIKLTHINHLLITDKVRIFYNTRWRTAAILKNLKIAIIWTTVCLVATKFGTMMHMTSNPTDW